MRTIRRLNVFKRDYKRELKGQHKAEISCLLAAAITELANDRSLPIRMRDHPLGGEWKGYRDCHLKPDLVLIYGKPDKDELVLVRLGSHSELGL